MLSSSQTIRIHRLVSPATVLGPYIRACIWVQGCSTNCKNCITTEAMAADGGVEMSLAELSEWVLSRSGIEGITISGGEPLFQENAVLELVKLLKGMDICLYTGSNLDEVPKEILPFLRYIKVGKYKKELKCSTKPYIGSSNQKFINLLNDKVL